MVLSYGIEAAAGTDAGASGTRNSACALFRASEPASACKRERALQGRFPPAPPITTPQPFSVGGFSCLSAPVPACSRGFLRKPADFAGQLMAPSRTTFHSLLAVFLSGLAPWNWPEVRKDRNEEPYRSTGYARTNQAVGLQHWQAEGTGSGQ